MVTTALVESLTPIREEMIRLEKDQGRCNSNFLKISWKHPDDTTVSGHIDEVLRMGGESAREIAIETMRDVRRLVGFTPLWCLSLDRDQVRWPHFNFRLPFQVLSTSRYVYQAISSSSRRNRAGTSKLLLGVGKPSCFDETTTAKSSEKGEESRTKSSTRKPKRRTKAMWHVRETSEPVDQVHVRGGAGGVEDGLRQVLEQGQWRSCWWRCWPPPLQIWWIVEKSHLTCEILRVKFKFVDRGWYFELLSFRERDDYITSIHLWWPLQV